ncbi:MAG: hypothetical protein E7264_05130 [Lachnospiraceae bacterium]|nr:hypothetical protein [Lachnospiraceae bacterium]
MADKMADVYEKYDIEVLATKRGRGATIIDAKEGVFIVEPFRGSIGRLEAEYVLKTLFEQEGFGDIDMLLLNKEGDLLTYDRYHQPFVLKKYFAGEECDMHNLADMILAVEKLADLHLAGQRVSSVFDAEWERTKNEKRQNQYKEIKEALREGTELDNLARIYAMTPAGIKEFIKEMETPECMDCKEERGTAAKQEVIACENEMDRMRKNLYRKNRELGKIKKYVKKVKRKNQFEELFLKTFDDYYEMGLNCEKTLLDEKNTQDHSGKSEMPLHYGVCHGNYNQHNVLMDGKQVSVVHFEKFTRGNQLDDLYQFTRKAMEKNHFDYEMLELILGAYSKKIALDKNDYRYMYILFSYPEKFWKIANGYYNSNKAFLSPKYLEKLLMLIEQEKEKNEMLEQYYAFHLC